MYFEGSINMDEKHVRDELYENLSNNASDDVLSEMLKANIVAPVLELKGDCDSDGQSTTEKPWTARANRILTPRLGQPCLLQEHGGKNWDRFANALREILNPKPEEKELLGNTTSVEGEIHS